MNEETRRSSLFEAKELATHMMEALLFSGFNGCKHYKRNVYIHFPCCNKKYQCRHCHNENETHQIDRYAIKEVYCGECNSRQKISNKCKSCGIKFANYFCDICNLFDNDLDKKIFHCNKCGICRVGDQELYFHCDNCNMCVLKTEDHRCRKNMYKDQCVICLEELFSSTKSCMPLDCNHVFHTECLINATKLSSNPGKCFICKQTFVGNEKE